MTAADAPARRRITLTGISSRAWEHPADRGALTALRELRGFDDVVRAFFGMWNERGFRLSVPGRRRSASTTGSIRAVYQRYTEAAAALDVAELPELYVTQSPLIWAPRRSGWTGRSSCSTPPACSSSTTTSCAACSATSWGTCGSGHAVYKTMLMILTRWAANLSWLPVGAIALRAIIAAMLEWWRKAELSADRAGLLAGQDPAAALRLLMKLAGGGDLSQIDTAAFLEQAAEYAGGGDLRDSLHKIRMTAWSTHPVPVARAAELRQWIDSGAYGRILAGDYPRRDDDSSTRRHRGGQGGRRVVPGGVQPLHRPAGRAAAPARRRRQRRRRVGRRHRRSGPLLDGRRHRGSGPRHRAGRADPARGRRRPADGGDGTGSAGTPGKAGIRCRS